MERLSVDHAIAQTLSRSCTTPDLEPSNTTVAESIGPLVISADDTWSLSADLPFFDPRLVVDTCAQFVSSSYQARTGKTTGEHVDRRSKNKPGSQTNGSNITLLQAMTCHAHEYAGADRLILELVPRCREFRDQLRQTVRPLCADMKNSNTVVGANMVNDAIMDYEVDRFFRARLVVCDLSELLTYDCFAGPSEEDEALARHMAVTKIPDFPIEAGAERRDYNPPYDAALELTVERFELRFWRTFSHGLGRALFGSKRLDLVERFEASAQDVFDRYEGELQLAMNSLMGWLPSWLSESLFIAFVGLGASVAIRQRSAKYTMLHRCVKSLIQSSGRYVFISTPAWYLPLVSWLPGLGRKEILRMPVVSLSLSLRSVWPSPCLDPDRCVAAVDEVWGGPKGERKAHLKLADGVESMGSWILRMTLGCERLFSEALHVLREYAPLFEEAFDYLAHDPDECDQRFVLPPNQAAGRGLAQAWAEKVHVIGNIRHKMYSKSMRRKGSKVPSRRGSSNGGGLRGSYRGSHRESRAMKTSTRGSHRLHYTDNVASRLTQGRESRVHQTRDVSYMIPAIHQENYMSRMPKTASWERRGTQMRDDEGPHLPSILAQLHADSHGPMTSSEPRLRSVIATGEGDNVVWWPLGQSDTFRERIPIHRTPDLAPHAAPPILEDIPTDFALPEAAETPHQQWKMMRTKTRIPSKDLVHSPSFNSQENPSSPHRSQQDVPPSPRHNPQRDLPSSPRKGSDEISGGGPPSPRSKRQGSRDTEGGKGGQANAKKAFNPAAGWQLQWFGLGRSGMRGYSSSQSAPQLTMPEDFRETLDRMWQSKKDQPSKILDAMMPGRRRPRSAPAAFDTSDFDVGNPAKNTAVAYALQMQIRGALASACSEGPLRLAWRQPKSVQEMPSLLRARFHLGSALLLAAMRAPLPSWEQLPLSHFTVLEDEVISQKTRLDPPTARLPDGVYAMGCSPLFHYIAMEDSARVPPLMAQAFHIGVPHAFLEIGPIRDALVERRPWKRWTEGSLLVLFTAGAFTEGHLASRTWAAERGWLQQDYASFFPLACCFRLVLGIEFLGLFHRHRSGPHGNIRLEDFFAFLDGADVENRNIFVKLDMCAEDGAKPLLMAPWIIPHKPPDPNFNPRAFVDWEQAFHPGSDGVALQDFAEWVGCLDPGRIVYSSHRSPTGDLYLKLEGALIVFGFSCPTQTKGPLTGQTAFEMYEDAIGEPEWWNVPMISYILMGTALSGSLESAVGSAGVHLYSAGDMIDGCDSDSKVLDKTEIIVCHPKILSSLLGPLRNPVLGHTQLFAKEIAEQEEEFDLLSAIWMARYEAEEEERRLQEGATRMGSTDTETSVVEVKSGTAPTYAPVSGRMSVVVKMQRRHEKEYSAAKPSMVKRGDDARVVAKRLRTKRAAPKLKPKMPQGSAVNAVEWRAKRTGKPKAQQLGQNLELLEGLFVHIDEHMQKLMATYPGLAKSAMHSENSPDPSRPSSRLTSNPKPPSSAKPASSRPSYSGGMKLSNSQDLAHLSTVLEKKLTEGTIESSSQASGTSPSSVRGRSTIPREKSWSILENEDLDGRGDEPDVRIERVPSPVRTEKSRKWRPPTPYPRLDYAALKALEEKEEEGLEAKPVEEEQKTPKKVKKVRAKDPKADDFVTCVEETGVFDFCGYGNWKPLLKDGKKHRARTSNPEILPPSRAG